MKYKLKSLRDNIKKYGRVIVAFSGGVDSSFLLSVSAEALGKENVLAVTAYSDIHDESELDSARKIAEKIGVRHLTIKTDELGDPVFVNNPPDRCYFCKKSVFSRLIAISKENNTNAVFDGSNADDTSDYRPGYKACIELGIKSPLLEEGITKSEIREFSREMNLPTWDMPSSPCLASRIPYGEQITKEKLEAIAKAEKFLRSLGFRILRVRHHGDIARIEISENDLSRFMQDDIRKKADSYLKSLGFKWITVDIAGFKSGSLNKGIGIDSGE